MGTNKKNKRKNQERNEAIAKAQAKNAEERAKALRKKRLKFFSVACIVAVLVTGIIILNVILSGGSGNPCDISCNAHNSNTSDCHCHGNCDNNDCECHHNH